MKTALYIGKIFPTLFLLAGLLFVPGCSDGSSGTTYTEQLQEMISAQWQSYAATHVNWGGGASLYITAPAENYFITPLALNETSLPYIGTDMTIPAPYADGFVWSSNSLFPATDDNMSGNVAEGNMISSLRDLAKWNRLLLRGEAGLHSDIVAQMMNCEPSNSLVF